MACPAAIGDGITAGPARLVPTRLRREDVNTRRRLRDYLDDQYQAITDGEDDLRGDLSSVHPVRVGVRRFSSTLRTYRTLFPAVDARRLDGELRWYGMLLGAVRDRQVQRRRMSGALAALPPELVLGPVAARIERELLAAQLEHTAHLQAALDSQRYAALRIELGRWAQHPPLTSRPRPRRLRQAAQRSATKTRKRLKQGLSGDDDALHRARRAAKRTRYAAELAGPALPHAKRLARRYEKVQAVLGDHQDTVVARDQLRRWAAATTDDPGANGFTYGLLYEREADLARWAQATAEVLYDRHCR